MTRATSAIPVVADRRQPGTAQRALTRPLTVAALAYLLLVTVAAFGAPWLAPYNPTANDLDVVLSGPSAAHWLGTDQLGRDVLSRLMWGGQVSLIGAVQATVTAILLGVPLGLVAGFRGGWVDWTATRIIDIALSIPVIVFLLVVLAVFGKDQTVAMVALGILGAPDLARIVRGATLSIRGELYITAARAAGLPSRDILLRQVLPAVSGPILVRTSLFAGGALLAQSGLSFLGLGVQPPTPTWGGMVAEASTVISRQPWLLIPAGATISLAILAFGLLGDAMRDANQDKGAALPGYARGRRPHRVTEPHGERLELVPTSLLSMRGVHVDLGEGRGQLLHDVSLEIRAGEVVGLVGESGSGKSITSKTILGLLPAGAELTAGSIRLEGHELSRMNESGMSTLRGKSIALISQEPMASLDPVYTVGQQLGELVRLHDGSPRRVVRARTIELLSQVNLPDPESIVRRYPHELSGGMAQRVAIAMALAGRPKLLIADEPTTALDVTVQAEILALLRKLQRETDMAILLITHDWGVVADICTRTYVMYAGEVVESGAVDELLQRPKHPYTAALLDSAPQRSHRGGDLPAIPGTVPSPSEEIFGCRFNPRCALAIAECRVSAIPLVEVGREHQSRCIRTELVRPRTSIGEELDHTVA